MTEEKQRPFQQLQLLTITSNIRNFIIFVLAICTGHASKVALSQLVGSGPGPLPFSAQACWLLMIQFITGTHITLMYSRRQAGSGAVQDCGLAESTGSCPAVHSICSLTQYKQHTKPKTLCIQRCSYLQRC